MVDAGTGAIDAFLTDGKGGITAEATLHGGAAHYQLAGDAVLTVTQFAIDLDRLGAVLDGSGSAAGSAIAGTGGGDVILGAGGRPLLTGAAGDDILVSGPGGAVMEGGAGNDAFVLSPTTETLRIMDFERGADRLDLSLFPMLRSLDQLGIESFSGGVWVKFDGTEIKVLSADGAPLTAADLWPGGFDTPDRFGLPAAPPEPAGTAGDDVLKGGAGRDRLRGLEGDDVLAGRGGRDRLDGNAGDDRLKGGTGDDRLAGGVGDDRMIGQAGQDVLEGGTGRDLLKGGAGDDRLTGGKGRDRFVFGADPGDDYIADFNPDQDRIRLDISGLGFDDLEIRAAEDGVEIDTGEGTILLAGVDAEDLDPEHFLFS